MQPVTITLNDLTGPLGLLVFLLLVVFFLVKWVINRIKKIEEKGEKCDERYIELSKAFATVKEECGYLKGKVDTLEFLNPANLVNDITNAVKGLLDGKDG